LDYSNPRNLIVVDKQNNRIRKITLDGDNYNTETLAGSGIPAQEDGPALRASFKLPTGIVIDRENNIYISETYNKVRKIYKEDNEYHVTTIAGTGETGYVDGNRFQAAFIRPTFLALDSQKGDLYVVDSGNKCVRVINISIAHRTIDKDIKSLMQSQFLCDVAITLNTCTTKLHSIILYSRCCSMLQICGVPVIV